MGSRSRPRGGSLQFWPRSRAARRLHKVNWSNIYPIKTLQEGILGFIAYKAGMATAIVKDTTDKSRTLNKQIAVPVTILEVPSMKIFSVRFYKNKQVISEVIVSSDKELKKKVNVPKAHKSTLDKVPENYDDIRMIVYSLPKQIGLKKTPDMIEMAIHSSDKLEAVKKLIGKEIHFSEFPKYTLFDVRGVTTGRGNQGPIQRFGLTLKQHKTEKGIRRPGSIAPWHPARVTFHTPMAGQMGFHSRVAYNLKSITSGTAQESDINPKSGFPHYGKVTASYIALAGSVPGPAKRPILLTPSVRPTKKQAKKKFEFQELITQ